MNQILRQKIKDIVRFVLFLVCFVIAATSLVIHSRQINMKLDFDSAWINISNAVDSFWYRPNTQIILPSQTSPIYPSKHETIRFWGTSRLVLHPRSPFGPALWTGALPLPLGSSAKISNQDIDRGISEYKVIQCSTKSNRLTSTEKRNNVKTK